MLHRSNFIIYLIYLILEVEMINMYLKADKKAKITLIGAAMCKFAGALSLIWGTINIYFFSYLRQHGQNIDSSTNSQLLLFGLIPAIISVVLANPFSRLVGYRNSIRICAILFTVSPMVINYQFNLVTFAVCWMIIPILCFCMASIPLINCLWTQFPKDLSKISGFAILIFNLGLISWNLIFLYLINPQNVKAEIDQSGLPIFPKQISDKIFTTSNITYSIAGTLNIVGSFLVTKRQSTLLQQQLQTSKQKVPSDDVLVNIQRAVSTISQKSEKVTTLKQGLTDKKFIILFLISGLEPVYLVYLMQNIKLIYMPIINDDHFLSYCSVIVTLSSAIGAPFWGFIGDSKGFKNTLLMILIFDLFVKIFGLYSDEKWSLVILFLLLGSNDRGLLAVIGPGLVSMFGIEMATELIPYKGVALISTYAMAPIILLLFNSLSHLGILKIFVGYSVIAITLSLYLKHKIHYKQKDPADQGYQMRQLSQIK